MTGSIRGLADRLRRQAQSMPSWRTILGEASKDALAALDSYAGRFRMREASDAASRPQHILMVDDLPPDPRFGAGYPRAAAIVQAFVAAGYRVSFYPMESTDDDIRRVAAEFGGAVAFFPGEGPGGLRRLLWRRGATFDILFISRPAPMRAFRRARWARLRTRLAPAIIYDAEAVVAPREALRRALYGKPWSAAEYDQALALELELAADVDAITAVTPGDEDIIRSRLKPPVFVLPYAMCRTPSGAPFDERSDLLFVGRLTGSPSSSPNVDSIVWFVREVMPLLDQQIGAGYKIHIAGMLDSPELEELRSDRIIFRGIVDDLDPLCASSRLFIAPTRYAAGMPVKVVEALGAGLPCAMTPLLTRQLSLPNADGVGDGSAAQFAHLCQRLYTSRADWEAARQAGLSYVDERYSRTSFDGILNRALTHVSQQRDARAAEPR